MKSFKLKNIQLWEDMTGAVVTLSETPWIELGVMSLTDDGNKVKKFCVQGYCFEVKITSNSSFLASDNDDNTLALASSENTSGSMFIDPSLVTVQKANGDGSFLGGRFGGCFEFEWD